ncbi:hypothetical protein [Microcoleus sp. FACHB-68]|uniref:hypothetical protein n=1 Tax=Microcoleus sp. FACHB-68 TaxID=2692826 RepID=UPI0016864CD8|nr:hypothetical protein [Microcoleus sp. FACHB-68]MBD1939106.1 hypothetical protein [Microcoleus sp. FACHB-68]
MTELEFAKTNILRQLQHNEFFDGVAVITTPGEKVLLIAHACRDLQDEFKRRDIVPVIAIKPDPQSVQLALPETVTLAFGVLTAAFSIACDGLAQRSNKSAKDLRQLYTRLGYKTIRSMSPAELKEFLEKNTPEI